jgi:hypothetical protein
METAKNTKRLRRKAGGRQPGGGTERDLKTGADRAGEAGMPNPVSLEILTWPIDKLVVYAHNPRKNDSAVDRMCDSIREYGFKIACLVRSDGELIDGHLRLKAARKLGLTEIPVILCDEWTPAQVKAPAADQPLGYLGHVGRGAAGGRTVRPSEGGFRSYPDRVRCPGTR